jgi:hypothetical protein
MREAARGRSKGARGPEVSIMVGLGVRGYRASSPMGRLNETARELTGISLVLTT